MNTRHLNLPAHQAGFNLMEIMVAVLIFVFGMLALAQLQGALTRASAEANARTTAVNVVEEIVEDRRGFGLMASDPDSDIPAYDEIIDTTYTVSRGGVNLTVTEDITDYYYERYASDGSLTDGFVTNNEYDKYYSDMKVLTVTVAWAGPGFVSTDGTLVSATDFGAGSISVSTIIKSAPSQTNALVITQESNNQITPLNPYSPGERPDVIGLDLGDQRFKESLTPMPDVISRDELVETNFDVITYSQTGDDSIFLRLENFKAVTCECALGDEDGNLTGEGRRPTVWAADEYEEGEWVTKVVGHSDNNNQSFYCDICCRDHHDSGLVEGEDGDDEGRYQYNPWRAEADYWDSDGSLDDDHKHYGYNNRGELVIADSAGEHYEESCRMVRVDGYWRLAHDFRREQMLVFPFDFFNYTDNINDYSSYVTDAVADMVYAIDEENEYYYDSTPETVAAPATDTFPTSTTLPTWAETDDQQLRTRGIYVDFMSKELRDTLDCLDPDRGNGSVETCTAGGSGVSGENTIELDAIGSDNFLEAIPFFDVQLTWLNRWTEGPTINVPVDTTNEALADDNAHSRGLAFQGGGLGTSTVDSFGHRGNIGFTDTDPIDYSYVSNVTSAYIDVTVTEAPPDPPAGINEVRGSIVSGVAGVQASRVEISAVDAYCNRTGTGFVCFIAGGNPTLTLTNFAKNNTTTAACSDTMTEQQNNDNANEPRALFDLETADTNQANDIIIIEANNCS